MSASLDGVFAKLDRANEHAVALKSEVNRILADGQYSIDRETDGQASRLVFRVHNAPVVTANLSLILGDFLTNVRASLDHLAWQLVLLDGNTPSEKLYFPIRERNVNKAGEPYPARIAGVLNPAVIKAIESIQPYAVGDERKPTEHPLYLLNRLVNIDKHRLLLVITQGLRASGVWWGSAVDDEMPVIRMNFGSLESGDPVAWFDFGGNVVPRNFDPHLSLELQLSELRASTTHRTLSMLDIVSTIYYFVEHQMLSQYFSGFFSVGPRHHATAFMPHL